MNEQERYERAKRRVEELKGFYSHLATYLLINLVLVVINLLTSREYLWFFWPLLGWGVGIIAHAVSVFGAAGFLGGDWEERKIRQIMEKDRKNHPEG